MKILQDKSPERPVRSRLLTLDSGGKLLEIPETNMPACRTPFHLSYLAYLYRHFRVLMSFYFKVAVSMCRITRTALIFLLHQLDFLDLAKALGLSFFPGKKLNRRNKDIKVPSAVYFKQMVY